MSTQLVKTFAYSGGKQVFVVPAGYSPDVDLYMWGAGGGAGGADGGGGYGGSGAAGWYLAKTITLHAGDTVEVAVGKGGTGGGSGSGYGRGAGGASYQNYTGSNFSSYNGGRDFGGGHGGQPGPSGWSGAGGGGGGATVLIVNSNKAYVAAGGGGGGGGSNYAPGYSAETSNAPTQYRHFSSSRNGAYPEWLNQNGIWNADIGSQNFDQIWTFYCPTAGTYTITGSCDDYGSVQIDGITRLSIGSYHSTFSASMVITAGLHSIRLLGTNTGGPGSIGVTVTGPAGTIFSTAELPRLSQGGTGRNCTGDGGGGGGGGGGITGGDGGNMGFDRYRGGLGGYSGTSTPGAIAPTYKTTPPGTESGYWFSPVGTAGVGTGSSGSDGLVVLVFKSNSYGKVKVSGQWRDVTASSVKVGGQWREVVSAWVKVNGQWKQVSGATPAINPSYTSSSYGPADEIPYYEDGSEPGMSGEPGLS